MFADDGIQNAQTNTGIVFEELTGSGKIQNEVTVGFVSNRPEFSEMGRDVCIVFHLCPSSASALCQKIGCDRFRPLTT